MHIYQTIHPVPPFLSVCICVGVHTYYITLPKTLLSLSLNTLAFISTFSISSILEPSH